MKTVTCIILCLFAVSACAPLVELEDENTLLRAKVDSLEILLGEYLGQTELLQERLSAVERENMQLDDRNRQLSARLAEMQYSETGTEGKGTTDSDEVRETNATTPGVHAGKASRQYREGTPPDLAFLREYQSALSAYNAKSYARAMRIFSGLLTTASPNDMIDNCVFWLGETHLQLGELEQAYARFTTVLEYDGSDKAAAALLSRARTAIALGRMKEARNDLERCVREFPQAESSSAARRLLRKLD